MNLRINETLQTGAVANRTYRVGVNAVRLETAPTRGESVYLFLKSTIVYAALRPPLNPGHSFRGHLRVGSQDNLQ